MARLAPDIDTQIAQALEPERHFTASELAHSAQYIAQNDLLLLTLQSGVRIEIPVQHIQGLAKADRALVANVKIDPDLADSLTWSELDLDFSVASLAAGRYGNERWMKRLSRPSRRKKPSGILTVHTVGEAEAQLNLILEATQRAHTWISQQSGDPMQFLREVKFEKKGYHPVTHAALNLIEQVNQTWTYRVALEATKLLLQWHQDAGGFTLAPGATASQDLDIMSIKDGLVGAEVFAAVTVNNNQKMKKDLSKMASRQERYRYVFFASPERPNLERYYRLAAASGVTIQQIAI